MNQIMMIVLDFAYSYSPANQRSIVATRVVGHCCDLWVVPSCYLSPFVHTDGGDVTASEWHTIPLSCAIGIFEQNISLSQSSSYPDE